MTSVFHRTPASGGGRLSSGLASAVWGPAAWAPAPAASRFPLRRYPYYELAAGTLEFSFVPIGRSRALPRGRQSLWLPWQALRGQNRPAALDEPFHRPPQDHCRAAWTSGRGPRDGETLPGAADRRTWRQAGVNGVAMAERLRSVRARRVCGSRRFHEGRARRPGRHPRHEAGEFAAIRPCVLSTHWSGSIDAPIAPPLAARSRISTS